MHKLAQHIALDFSPLPDFTFNPSAKFYVKQFFLFDNENIEISGCRFAPDDARECVRAAGWEKWIQWKAAGWRKKRKTRNLNRQWHLMKGKYCTRNTQ